MGGVGALLALTETGRARAREALETNQYAGPAPVPLDQYTAMVRRQKPKQGWLAKENLTKALRGMVITERILSQVGPAVSSANSMLIYGKPGDGKTYLIESLQHLQGEAILVPYAIECQGNIVQVYDPIYHRRVEEEETPLSAIARESSHDGRWIKCHRPFIVTGGELSTDMLDLRYNVNSKVYEAPFQLKANNGIYLIDDFGRQIASPAEVLNRWIVPMERKVDYLSFLTGGKMTAPFETFLVFSTNLNPSDLGDEAFLRRIQYKMLLRGPSTDEFMRIFQQVCVQAGVPFEARVIEEFVERQYKVPGKPFRRCHPRDLFSHAMNLVSFEKLPRRLTANLLDRAFESCFLSEEQDSAPIESPIVQEPVQSCAERLTGIFAPMSSYFGKLAMAASFLNRESNTYQCVQMADYAAPDVSSAMAALHTQFFRDWLALGLEEQTRDLIRYRTALNGPVDWRSLERPERSARFAPVSAKPPEIDLFTNDLTAAVRALAAAAVSATATPAAAPAPQAALGVAPA
jgi:hypothetical protein